MKTEELLFIVFVSFFIGATSGILMGKDTVEYRSMCERAFQIVAIKAKEE